MDKYSGNPFANLGQMAGMGAQVEAVKQYASPEKRPTILDQVQELQKECEVLSEAVNQLERAIESVLAPATPREAKAVQGSAAATTLGGQVSELLMKIRYLRSRLLDIGQRVDL